ncbi:hypothetical protein O4H49_04320 [Kiloniella laminariae]|uniref:Lipoprotein n=1 Tax=Kiloniella laminariae TaxID=454162 RepID=A0ABT4LGC1_9PROT|nr:hypothetical protein [Kiloniella laminariae]MCZ4279990.1 hypothetical protein [Kiloniella laminariae]
MSVRIFFALFLATSLTACLDPLVQVGVKLGVHTTNKVTSSLEEPSYGNANPDGNTGTTSKKSKQTHVSPTTPPVLICTKEGDSSKSITQNDVEQIVIEKRCEAESDTDSRYYKASPNS